MATNQFKLERLNSSGTLQKGIKFLTATGIGDNITISNIQFSTPGANSDSNFSQNWGGFKRLISVTALLHNDGTDKSTEGSSKVTLMEQKQHLMNPGGVVQSTNAVNDYYRVTLYINGVTETITGSLEDISVNGDTGNAMTLQVTFNLFQAGN